MIIVFSGVDCSGKSTQISLLSRRLDHLGIPNITLWCRGGYSPGFVLLKSITRFIFRAKLPSPGRSLARTNTFRNSWVTKLWLFISIFDLVLFWSIYLRLLDLLGFVIICDRYIDDTRIDFALNFPNTNFEKSLIWKILVFSVPRPQVSFLLLISPDISLKRSLLKKEPFPDSLSTLKQRYALYRELPAYSSMPYHGLRCLSSPEEIFNQIINKLVSLNSSLRSLS